VRRDRQIVSSAQIDPGLTFVGGSPFQGDISATGILVPSAPTPSQNRRYLFRCCGLGLGPNQTAYVRSLRYYLWIGVNQAQNNGIVHFEQLVTTPGWRFPDGNASFHLRRIGAGSNLQAHYPTSIFDPPGIAFTANGVTPALLGRPIAGVYFPINGGLPYGQDVAGLGTIRDVRFDPYQTPHQDLDLQVVGPGNVEVFASVHQTDPTTRTNWAGPKDIREGLCPEDRFVVTFDLARFWRVGAEMTVDICTWDPEGWCKEPGCDGRFNPNISCKHRPASRGEFGQ
jgi:hypothetical protein